MSGQSNVKYWLREHGYEEDDQNLVQKILAVSKKMNHTLTEEELEGLCRGA
jgi:isopropylmalate/homocitrate/citramalate synthase